MNLVALAFAVLLFAGCASIEPSRFIGPNGRAAYSMKCSGLGRTLDACYQKAGELCPQGYRVVDRSSGLVVIPVNGSIMAAPREHLAVECK